MRKEALLYEKKENKHLSCRLCAHRCLIAEGKFGFCGVRQNIGGILYAHNYGRAVAANVDPVEKKPLYHFFPGHLSFSLAAAGCNFRCGFCQNWEISQLSLAQKAADSLLPGRELPPQEIVRLARENGCKSISYTYTEPTIFFEYALDTAKLARAKGLYNIFVTNGYMTKEALILIKPYLDAANIDLKFFKDSSYKKVCAASLTPVLDSIRLMHKLGIWIELTTLVVPGENDSQAELAAIAGFISGVDKNIPWHISRFHPAHKFSDKLPTAEAALKQAAEIGAQEGLRYIYIGNLYGAAGDTSCHNCGRLLVKRQGFSVLENAIKAGSCPFCGAQIAGVLKNNN